MAENTRKKLAIIDGKSVFYRGYYAIPNLSTKDGTPTGGVFGFATMALEVIKRLKPDYVCVAWDKPKTNIRKRLEMYPQYKAGRKTPPPDFYEQIPLLRELLEAFGWPLYELDDYEADDIMGAFAVQAKSKDIDTMLITSDLDALQLVNSHTHVYALKKGLSNIELFHPESFEAKYGIIPEQFLDLKALKGDSSDNIPGVPGVGEKTALELLKQYKTLDEVYNNLDLIKETTKKKLEAGKDSAYLSKKLAAIWTDAPVKLNLKEVDGSKRDVQKVHDILVKLEFKSLVRQLPEVLHTPELMSVVHNGLKIGKNILIDDNKKLNMLKLNTKDNVILHSRCAGKHGRKPELLIISQDPKITYSFDLRILDKKLVLSALKILENEQLPKIGYDIKSTIKTLTTIGINIKSIHHDVSVGAFLINSLRREQTLTDLARTDVGYEGGNFEETPTDELLSYCPDVVAIIRALYDQQVLELKGLNDISKLAKNIEWPLIPVLADMEYKGIELDADYLKEFSLELGDSVSDLEQKIYGFADQEFNISSPIQLSEILYKKLNLPTQGVKKGKSGYSTAANELEKLRELHPIINLVSQYREVTKLKSTYVDTLPTMVDENSRLHTTFSLTVAQTGRLSSSDPNLQNIPTKTELGRHIRKAFISGNGKVFVNADYSQFELRLAAFLANDKELIDMFNKDVDVHTATAAQINKCKPEDVTKNMRSDAKAVNFGILYGMSPHGLSIATGMTNMQAKDYIDKYSELRKPLFDYTKGLLEQARKNGYVETMFGRRRPMPDINSSNFIVRSSAERAAMNMPIQGTEADLMKIAMIETNNKLDSDCHMLLQLHDSILVECPKEKAEKVAKLLKNIMENIYKLPVKLTVDTASGDNWSEL